MRRATYHLRSLLHHWRTNLAVVLGATVGTAALTGALLVGDSMRASLRDLALKRLGNVDYALIGARFFERSLADRISAQPEFAERFNPAYSLILLRGGVTHVELRTRVDGVGVIGVDQDFWNFQVEKGGGGSRSGRRAGNRPTDRPTANEAIDTDPPGATGGSSASVGGKAKRSAAMNEPQAQSERPPGQEHRVGDLPAILDDFTSRSALLNQELADELHAKPGDVILVRLGKPSAISTETLLGRRDDAVSTLRLTVQGIVPDEYAGQFSLNPAQSATRNIFVPIATLQRAIDQPDRANAIIVSAKRAASFCSRGQSAGKSELRRDTAESRAGRARPNSDSPGATGGSSASEQGAMAKRSAAMNEPRAQSERLNDLLDPNVLELQTALHRSLTLSDLGLHLRIDNERKYVALESDSILIDPAIEKQALNLPLAFPEKTQQSLAHLANRIAKSPDGLGIPYSTIVATQLHRPLDWERLKKKGIICAFDAEPGPTPPCKDSEILLNQWAADDLKAKKGDDIYVTYYITDAHGQLKEQTSVFQLAGIVPMDHKILGDSGLVPTYPGITNVDRLSEWDAPFPIDFNSIREKDEQYWEQYRTLPKAFFQLGTGQKLWAGEADHFGRLTSIQFQSYDDANGTKSLAEFADDLSHQFIKETPPQRVGLEFDPLRARALQAATGSTDFGMLFLGFSFFVIVSAAMLVALLFRLGIERRASEVGLLLATGFDRRAVSRMLLIQGAFLAIIGGIIGLIVARAYAWLMLAGLRTWWSAAVGITAIELAIEPVSLAIGFGASVVVALFSIIWAMRGLTGMTPRSLLAGSVSSDSSSTRTTARRRSTVVAAIGLIAAASLAAFSFWLDAQARAGAFFGAGAATLTALLALLRRWLHGTHEQSIIPGAATALTKLGIRNAPRNPGRSLLTAGLIASAMFVITSIQAFRIESDPATLRDKDSGSGGFNLYAESAAGLPYDLSTETGRDALGFDANAQSLLAETTILPLRLRPGDESSCLNLYRPTEPRILAASAAMIERGGFTFSSTLAETEAERANPWTLLNREYSDGAIPVIGDEAAVMWQLHLGLGQDMVINDERGRLVTLRFVALLKQSVLQDELVIAESRFVGLFPSIAGRTFFLIQTPVASQADVEQAIERTLERYGFDVQSSADRLDRFLAVQNTYLATFRNLGGLGLLLGTTGLGAVLLRNVWERRRELALLRAVGFGGRAIGWIVLVENVFLLLVGLASGTCASVVAIAPTIASSIQLIPWISLTATLLIVLVIGCSVCLAATWPALRAPLVRSLRTE